MRGVRVLFMEEHNARVHLMMAVVVIVAGCFFNINAGQWVVLVGVIGLVLALEALNTAIEALADMVSPGYHPLIAKCKDLAAAAVLVAALAALVIGCIIFIPKICLL